MATFLYRLGRLSFVRRRLVVLLWVVLLGLAGAGAAANSEPGSAEFTIPGTEAQRAFDLLNERYPGSGADGATARVVVRAPEGELITDPAHRAAVQDLVEDLRTGSDKVAQVADPYETQAVSQDGTTAYAQVSYLVKGLELEEADRDALEAAVDAGRATGLTVEMGGDALLEIPATGITEVIGVAVAAVALVVTLGSLVAAGLPLLTALIGVGVAVATITALTATLDLDSTTPILAMMLGLAVGIDYALFIVSRYRAELAEGHPHREAAGRALGTAGSAVVFAGLTVIIALAGLAVVNIPILTKMGLAAAGSVAVAVLIALTMIPALLGFAGDRILPRAARRARDAGPAVPAARTTGDASPAGTADGSTGASGRPNLGTRWARWVLRRPLAVLLVGAVGLGALALPAADLELGLPDDGSKPTDTTPRRAYDLLAESFGAGFNGPLMVVVDGRDAADGATAAAERARDRIAGLDDVAVVTEPMPSEDGSTAILTVIPATKPLSTETEDLVGAIRDSAAALHTDTGATLLVTGQTAMGIDVSQKLDDALLPYLALVVGLAFLLLILVFRSLLVPLKAALGFLLSVLAALGAVVAVFQWGWLGGLFGVEETGPVMSLMPIFLVGVVFGLAMDYEVFLVTRMREAYVHGLPPEQAVVTGFRHGARVVTAAAIIMISVFAGFVGSDEPMIKMIGLGLAIAVFFDAFVVRMTLVPAVLGLLGRSAWWLPGWLDRILPDVDVEGEKLQQRLAGPDTEPRTRESAVP
ncbi:MMPL family transporter [Streptomyces carpaticus]|uniref:MMPL family transporter n=3 Tax=Streptomyces TaxID=1883 RepID=A0ABN2VEF5_9ACTN|nr:MULTISPECIES: MMPL family transporter [Streptomyces]QKV71738.1 MMPL family transporter [Streptomyces harbinensis]UWM52232.1 MMPL family transporter [Streptomyces carpaticus]SFT16228.1 putative drug exporter of the RND superfamily [Streptomyces harbinensis]